MADRMESGHYPFLKIPRKTNDPPPEVIMTAVTKTKTSTEIINEMLIGRSAAMLDVKDKIADFSQIPAPILVTGESGTGKDITAQLIHRLSGVSGRYVAVNCAAIPEGLLESELFGHVAGSFTGANRDRMGKFEYANDGVLFLDEIGDIPLNTQVKILRAIETKSVELVGSNITKQTSFRLVCATNKDIVGLINKGLFREDLYYRINTMMIHMPTLRSMPNDIENIFVKLFTVERKKLGLKYVPLTKGALAFLERTQWPGNVRQLSNLVISLSTFGGDEIGVDDLKKFIGNVHIKKESSSHVIPEKIAMEYYDWILDAYAGDLPQFSIDLEAHLIKKCLSIKGNNQVYASKLLGISRNTLRSRIEERQSKFQQEKTVNAHLS